MRKEQDQTQSGTDGVSRIASLSTDGTKLTITTTETVSGKSPLDILDRLSKDRFSTRFGHKISFALSGFIGADGILRIMNNESWLRGGAELLVGVGVIVASAMADHEYTDQIDFQINTVRDEIRNRFITEHTMMS